MSLKPLALGLLASTALFGGFVLTAHAAGQVLEDGAEGLAALLVGSMPSRNKGHAPAGAPQEPVAPPLSSGAATANPTSRAARTPPTPIVSTSSTTPPSVAPTASTGVVPQPAPKPTQPRSAPSAPKLSRVTRPPTLRLRTDAPSCDDVYVYIVSIFERARDSVATLALDPQARGRPRRVGQRLGRYEVIGIGYNASRVSSAVWLKDGNRVCQALVRDAHPVREKRQLRQLARSKQKSAAARTKARKQKKAKRGRATRHR